MSAKIVQVIYTNPTKYGLGKDSDEPARRVEQWWDFDGNLLWEMDPCDPFLMDVAKLVNLAATTDTVDKTCWKRAIEKVQRHLSIRYRRD